MENTNKKDIYHVDMKEDIKQILNESIEKIFEIYDKKRAINNDLQLRETVGEEKYALLKKHFSVPLL